MERDALNEMYRVLRPGGQIIINVAALKFLTGNHSVLGGEVRRYHRSELRDHLVRTGFTVLRITYTNFTLLPLVAGVRFAQRLAGHQESTCEITVPVRAGQRRALGAPRPSKPRALKLVEHAARQLAARLARRSPTDSHGQLRQVDALVTSRALPAANAARPDYDATE